ncbi:hypothetical protein ON010_g11371 [Phytophthora cinnamomi]|nr:hypothetical protein ON010_g11371 [Phytophthora cinnamomi]
MTMCAYTRGWTLIKTEVGPALHTKRSSQLPPPSTPPVENACLPVETSPALLPRSSTTSQLTVSDCRSSSDNLSIAIAALNRSSFGVWKPTLLYDFIESVTEGLPSRFSPPSSAEYACS